MIIKIFGRPSEKLFTWTPEFFKNTAGIVEVCMNAAFIIRYAVFLFAPPPPIQTISVSPVLGHWSKVIGLSEAGLKASQDHDLTGLDFAFGSFMSNLWRTLTKLGPQIHKFCVEYDSYATFFTLTIYWPHISGILNLISLFICSLDIPLVCIML